MSKIWKDDIIHRTGRGIVRNDDCMEQCAEDCGNSWKTVVNDGCDPNCQWLNDSTITINCGKY